MRLANYILMALVLLAPRAQAQTVVQSPPVLNSVPKGATDANPFWQHLVITLTRNPSAGNTITVNLPVGIALADTDGDGAYGDEVALDDLSSTGTGYTATTGTSAGQIVLESSTGGVSGQVHVQYPITTPSSPTLPNAAYGQISFSNGGEGAIPAGSLVLNLIEPEDLSIATFSRLFVDGVADTTTNAQGDAYPAAAAAAFDLELPDLVSDLRGNLLSDALRNAAVPFADGSDSNDVQYTFWFSTRDTLALVDTTVASVAFDRNTQQAAQAAEKSLAVLAFDTSALLDTTYHLYMTSNLTGNFPLLRSRGIRIRHMPVVLSVGDFRSGDADFLDSGMLYDFDTGQVSVPDSARRSVSIAFNAIDFDDSASVRLFYAIADTLDTTFVTVSGTAPNRVLTGLTNATDIDSTAGLREGKDSQFNWNIATDDTTYIARGDYYIYAVITDGTDLGGTRSDHTYNVRHSPQLIFDSGQDRALNTGGTAPDRYYAITWNRDQGRDGDSAFGDSATIALYYSASDSFAVPNGVAELQAAAADSSRDTHLIVSDLQEQPDGRSDNQYVWDLWTYVNPDDRATPKEGIPYYIYGLVETDSTSRVVRWNDDVGAARKLTFTHDPYLRPLAPRSSVAAMGRQSIEVEWLAEDVDDSAAVWLVLTTAAASLSERTTYAALVADAEPDWIVNSSDGSLANGVALQEDSIGNYAIRPAQLVRDRTGAEQRLFDGGYALYLVIDPGAANPPTDSSLAVAVPGEIEISGLPGSGAGGLQAPAMELLPAEVSVTVPGDTTLFELRPHSNGQNVDLVAFFASVDTTFFDVVDQDTAAGVQPFKLASSLTGIALRDTMLAGADSLSAGKWLVDLIYFEQSDMNNLDGSLALATMQLVSKDTLGATTVDLDHLGNRKSAFYRDGEEVALIAPEVAVRAQILPRGTLSGKVKLQGRSDHQNVMTLLLRDHNSLLPIGDSLFAAANDMDSTKAGIQDSIATDGSFSLTQVPTGDYHLAVHFDGFLDGQYPAVSINPGDQLTGINPTFLADGVTDVGYLLGGDVTGYADTSGLQIPDNEIDQLDIDFVISYFGQSVSAAHAGRLADIDGDSLVWVPDLNIIAANFNLDGVAPVYKRAAAEMAVGAWSLTRREAGGELAVEVWADDLGGARAYGYRLHYDPTQLKLRSTAPGAAFAARSSLHAVRRERDAVAMGAALNGDQPVLGGRQLLGTFVFAALQPGAAVEIRDAQWIDAAHRVRVPRGQTVRPSAYALSPNFPNPFNPETSLRLHLPQSGQVWLDVFDAAGQRVRSLVSGQLAAGVHVAVWDGRDQRGRDVASGTYFARLRAGGVVQVSKMILLR